MNKNIERILIFLIGSAIGSGITYKIIKEKYEKIANDEIKSVKEMYKNKNEMNTVIDEVERAIIEKDDYSDIIKENHYSSENNDQEYINEDVNHSTTENEEAFVITPEEYGENSDYEMVTLTLYNDGVLCDEDNEEIKDIEGILNNTLEYFGAYDDDSLFVRNPMKKCDYEIIKVDEPRYALSTPHQIISEEDEE